MWDAETGKAVHEVALGESTRVRFSPDGRWLWVATDRDGYLLECGTWRTVRRVKGRAVFSPDGRLTAVADVPEVVRLVEPESGREVARLTAPRSMTCFPECFTPDGTRLVAASASEIGMFSWDLRAIRQQLKLLNLDWDWPDFLPSAPDTPAVKVEVDTGDLYKQAPQQTPEQRASELVARFQGQLKNDPDDARACNGLAWIFSAGPAKFRDVNAAVPLAEKAVKLAPANANYANTLGVAYYRAGRYAEAIDVLRPNLERQVDAALALDLFVLAMSHHAQKEPAQARSYYDWAVRWARSHSSRSVATDEEFESIRAEAEKLLDIRNKR